MVVQARARLEIDPEPYGYLLVQVRVGRHQHITSEVGLLCILQRARLVGPLLLVKQPIVLCGAGMLVLSVTADMAVESDGRSFLLRHTHF